MNFRKDNQNQLVIEKKTKAIAYRHGVFLFGLGGLLILIGFFDILKMIAAGELNWDAFIIILIAFIPFYFGERVLNRMVLIKIILNRKEKTITQIWGAPNQQDKEDVKKYDDQTRFLLSKQESTTSKGKPNIVFTIGMIDGSNDENQAPKVLDIDSQLSEYMEACYYAEYFAVFCGLLLEDAGSGQRVVKNPEDMLKRGTLRVPEIPESMNSFIKRDDDNIIVEFPPYRIKAGCIMPLVLIGTWIVMWSMTFLQYFPEDTGILPHTRLFYLRFSGIMTICSILFTMFMIIYLTGRRQRLIIKPTVIQYEKYKIMPKIIKILPKYKIKTIDMDSLTLMNQRAILLHSDKGNIKIGNINIDKVQSETITGFLKDLLLNM